VFEISALAPGQTLALVGCFLFERYDFCSQFRCVPSKMHEFLQQVQRKYHAHPYHNAEHAADVAQSLHHFFAVGTIGNGLSLRKKAAAILAAVIHDVGHTSFSNNFHIASNDELAIQYLYRSPLEHMHCALAFQIMKSPQSDILQGLSKIEQVEIRNLVTDMVLATDNSVHSIYLARLEGLSRREMLEAEDEKLVLQMALHAADVSNPAKPMRFYAVWADRIMNEFYLQGDRERELGLPLSVGYDRENPIAMEKMQAGFIIGIVRPLFSAICQLPNAQLDHCLHQLHENLTVWQNQIASTSNTSGSAFSPGNGGNIARKSALPYEK